MLVSGCASAAARAVPTEIVVSAAADLTFAFQEIGAQFQQATGTPVNFNFGSTGQLAQQIEQGAPVDLFAAADIKFLDDLIERGRILPETKALYARGRITLWTRADSGLHVEQVADLTRADLKLIAIANPDHAPYGIAAREAMQAAGVWQAVQPKLVLGENALATLQYAQRGDVDVAIAPLSLSLRQPGGRWVLIPQELYQPIDQALAVVKGSAHVREASAFAAFINGPEGRAIMRKYGFILPGEEPPK
jgi:molybdate transport system substrate-binding protein